MRLPVVVHFLIAFGISASVFVVIVFTVLAFARPNISWRARLSRWMPGLITGVATVILGLGLYYGVAVARYDCGKNLRDVAGISAQPSASKTILMFVGKNEMPLIKKNDFTSGGLNISQENVRKVQDYLAMRNYRTAKSRDAFYYLLDSARFSWDIPSYLQTSLEMTKKLSSLIGNPFIIYGLWYSLSTFSASKESLQIIDELADESTFFYSRYLRIADHYWRLGQREKALAYYRKAGFSEENLQFLEKQADEKFGVKSAEKQPYQLSESPPSLSELEEDWQWGQRGMSKEKKVYSRIGELYFRFGQKEKALACYQKGGFSTAEIEKFLRQPFVSGKIEGNLTINGNPIEGIKVGLRGWINPKDLGKIFKDEINPTDRYNWMRIMPIVASTTTEKNGRFLLENLTGGEYALAIMADTRLIPADLQKIKVINAPGKITLDEQSPVAQLGQIDIVTSAGRH
jgi:tetratricopeptide (TPR) repeat protein